MLYSRHLWAIPPSHCDEPWPFFHFWRQPNLHKLYSTCPGGKRLSNVACPDHFVLDKSIILNAKYLCCTADICGLFHHRIVMSLGLSSTSDVNQICISYTPLVQEENVFPMLLAQIRVTGQMEPEMWTKMLKKLSGKLLPLHLAASIVKVARLDYTFLEVF